jgi:negative regulator of sigma E activity
MVDQGPPVDAQCPSWAASLGYMGVAAAVCLSNWGSAVSIKRHNPSTILRFTIDEKIERGRQEI